MKKCSICRQKKPLNAFYLRKKSKDGHRAECKECQKTRSIKYQKEKIKCDFCGRPCWSKKSHRRCDKCRREHKYQEIFKLTLGEKTYNKHKYAKYSYIRYFAKQIAKDLGWSKCCVCGYKHCIEIAHILPISSFSPDTRLVKINNSMNLIPLCPNCHWEFDNNILLLSDIPIIHLKNVSGFGPSKPWL